MIETEEEIKAREIKEAEEKAEAEKKSIEDERLKNQPSPLEEADRINKEKATLLDREEKLQDRKEKIIADEAVGGRARAGQEPEKKEETPQDYSEKVMKGEVEFTD